VSRRIDALVLSPERGDRPPVRVEVCGDRSDMAVFLALAEDVDCFAEPVLVDTIGTSLPATWLPRPREYDRCPSYGGVLPYGQADDWWDTGGWDTARELPCSSDPLLRVVAGEGRDAASALALPMVLNGRELPAGADPSTADPRIEVVDGEPVAGGQVLLQFSVAASWTEQVDNYIDPYPEHYWYVEAGTPWGSGVTMGAGFDAEGRAIARNRLAIPADHHGPLRIAVVRHDPVPVWAELTLEVR